MTSMTRMDALVRRINFVDGGRHLVFIDRKGQLDTCDFPSPRAVALMDRTPPAWRIVGVFSSGITLPQLAAQVRAAK